MSFRCLAIALTLACVGVPIRAQTTSPACDDLSRGSGACLPWGHIDLKSELGNHVIADLSRDGSVVAGVNTSVTEVFQWKLGSGKKVFIRPGSELMSTISPALSADGSVLVGVSTAANRVFRWDVDANTWIDLPNGTADGISNVYPARPDGGTVVPNWRPTVSGDGNTIAGFADVYDGNGSFITNLWGFLWTQSVSSDRPQEDYTGGIFTQPVVAGNGFHIVGSLLNPSTNKNQAAYWVPASGTTLLPPDQSYSTAVSFDGQTVAGEQDDSGANLRAWRWTQTTDVEVIVSQFFPRAVSDDGNLIAGLKRNTTQPWIWRNNVGDESLLTYLADNFGLNGFAPSAGDPVAVVSGGGAVFSALGTQWIAKVPPLKAVGLGDSYASGVGAFGADPPYIPGTDNPQFGNQCHRSLRAYFANIQPRTSQLAFRQLQENDLPGFSWYFFACSGAATDNVRAAGEALEGEPAQLANMEVDEDTDLVTVQIGGNDVLFGDVAAFCVFESGCADLVADFSNGQTLRAFMPGLVAAAEGPVRSIFIEITSKAPNATVVAVGYPLLVAEPTTGNETENDCPDAQIEVPFSSTKVGGLDADERAFIRTTGDHLEEVLKRAARDAGVHYVSVQAAFEGNNLCNSHPYIIEIAERIDRYKDSSFHPTVTGQRIYAREIRNFLERGISLTYPQGFFESGMPRNPVPANP